MSQLSDTDDNTKVNIKVKVIDHQAPTNTSSNTSSTNKLLAVANISKKSPLLMLLAWNNHIVGSRSRYQHLLESYHITKLFVRVFNGDHYLSLPKTGSTITHVTILAMFLKCHMNTWNGRGKGLRS